MLLWREIEKVVCIHIERQSNKNDDGKGDKARAVGHRRKKGQQEHPECDAVSASDQRKWVRECLFDRNVII